MNGTKSQRWGKLKQAFTGIVFSTFFYVFMEWIFLITKPSFMDMYSLVEKFKIFLLSALIVSVAICLTIPVLFLLDFLLSRFVKPIRQYIYFIPAVFILTCLGLILLDNFTYTLFKFGIVSTTGVIRAMYGVVFAAVFVLVLRKTSLSVGSHEKPRKNSFSFTAALSLFFLSALLAGFTYKPAASSNEQGPLEIQKSNLPNIILLNSDGLNAGNMSAYGYERDTTPFMDELVNVSLVGQNNFSNASASRGSETATLTGKLPLFTRVLIVSNTLQDANQYEHLPGRLKRAGYRTVSLGVKNYVDVNSINFVNAFDEVNCQANLSIPLSGFTFDDELYLISSIRERIQDRLSHIFFIQKMDNTYSEVTNAMTSDISDQERMDCLYNYLDEAVQTGQPLFAHLHLMGTHGPEFDPDAEVYSRDLEQDEDWMTDFYDDSIIDFDQQVEDLVTYLKEKGLYENTILVIFTDHGQKWSTTTRIPLIMHFPKDEHAGWITENTQNIDIAPTLLDYLELPQPDWMTGSSLLQPVDANRLIIATRAVKNEDSSDNVVTDEAKVPPFYQFGSVSMIQCQNITIFDLQHTEVRNGTVSGYPNPCPEDTLYPTELLHNELGKILLQAGFDLPQVW